MDEKIIKAEFDRIEEHFFNTENWQSISLNRSWANSQPKEAGVYMLFEDGKPVYVGETGNISGRIKDMLDTRHHTVRRSLGEDRFSKFDGYIKATSKLKHSDAIESLINTAMTGFKICVLPLKIGRKEFEEYIFTKYQPKLNRRFKRSK